MDDDLKRKLKNLSAELEAAARDLPAGRRPPALRRDVAGIGLAACIAVGVVLFTQLLPKSSETKSIRPAASGTEGRPDCSPGTPTQNADGSWGCYQQPTLAPPEQRDPAPDESGAPVPPTARPSPAPSGGAGLPCTDPGSAAPPPDHIKVWVEAKSTGPHTARLTAHIRNDGSTAVHYEQGRPWSDFVVYAPDGTTVAWVYSDRAVFTADARVGDYAPGQEDSFSVDWNEHGCGQEQSAPLPAGPYRIRAKWTGTLGGWSEPIDFPIFA